MQNWVLVTKVIFSRKYLYVIPNSCHLCGQVELFGHLGEHQREEFRKMKLLMEEAMKLREEEEEEINQVTPSEHTIRVSRILTMRQCSYECRFCLRLVVNITINVRV